MNKEEKEEFDILVELGVLQSEVRKVDRHIHNNYRKKIYKLEKRINKAIKYIEENEFYYDYKTGACVKGVIPLLNILRGEDNE
ncbi:MAG: hypothetical protein IKF36_01415 [Bacilli bacterium]|nr:hypothetical protein [Bacilli bacterium]